MARTSPARRSSRTRDVVSEVEELRRRLEEAEQALEAIRTGQVESLIVEGPEGPRVFSLEGEDHAYRVLVEAMNEGAATLARDGTILYCNARFAAMLDSPLEQVMGSPIFPFLAKRSRETFDTLVYEAEGGESRGELELIGPAGSVVPAYLSMSVIRDCDNGARLCLIATDLRAQKRSEELTRSVLEQAAEAIVVCNDRGVVVRASTVASELCGGTPVTALFDDVFRVKLDSPAPGTSGTVAERALRGEVLRVEPATAETCHARADLLVSAAPLTLGDRIVGCVISMSDVTERKRAYTALQELNVQLADADRRKNEFLAVLSHELRNPLAPVTNSLSILDHAAPGSDEAKIAHSVLKRQVDQLVRLVDDLLDVTRITRSKVQLKLERIDLVAIVRETVQDHLFTFEARGVALEASYPEGRLMVNGDAARLAQIVGNVLANASKFTARGGVAAVSVEKDDRGSAVIRVVDSGAGMTPETIARMFEPFSQADRTLDRSRGGLGLGLALVKGLVDLHGGEVCGESAGPGQGSAFTIRLPLDLSETEEVAVEAAKQEHGPWRILVIEDNVDSAESLRLVLEARGHTVEVAYDGDEGLEKARAWKPDLVLCDIGLPGMDGYEVAQAIRTEDALKDTRLVALTGYAMPEDVRRASSAGFNSHLAKPLRLEKLDAFLAGA